MESVGVLIVGAGKIAGRHAAAWQSLTSGRVAVADAVEERARLFAEKLPGLSWESDPDAALERAEYDIIDICVPTPFHSHYALAALAAGKHVFGEKPLCDDVADAHRILEAARSSARHVQVGYLFRFHPSFIQVSDWLKAGLIGQPHMVLIRMGGRGSAALWKHRAGEGGGVVNEMVVHKLDLLMWLFGDLSLVKTHVHDTLLPTRVIDDVEHEVDAPDFIFTEFRSDSNRIFLQSDLATPAYMENIEIHGPGGSIVASVQEKFQNFLFLPRETGGLEAGYHYKTFGTTNLFQAELADFAGRLDEEPHHGELREAVQQVELLEQLRGDK